MTKALFIAVCGESGAGKSTTTQLLADAGFEAYSLSSILRREAEEAYGNPTRAQVQTHGKTMQTAHGNDYYARRLVETTGLMASCRAVVDGMRNLDEIAFLRAQAAQAGAQFRLLALVVDADTRFQRVMGRARGGDPTTKDQFAVDDTRANGAEGAFQNNLALINAADWRVENTGDHEALAKRLHGLIAGVTSGGRGGEVNAQGTATDARWARCRAAQRIVREAGDLARAAFADRDQLSVRSKGTQDWVSNVDLEVETLIRRRLDEAFPGEPLLGEEIGHSDAPAGATTWIIDPIDGTNCFLLGIPQWCVVLCHAEDARPVVAAIYDTMADHMYTAVAGDGAFLNDAPIRVSSASEVSTGLVSIGASANTEPEKSARFMAELVTDGGMYLRIGASALGLCYVASGRLLGMWEPLVFPWDDLAGMLIVREAGGRTSAYPERIVTDRPHPVLAAAPGIWPRLSGLL